MNSKGMIFTLEAVLALVLFTGFIAYSLFYLENPASVERTTILTQKIDNLYSILDEQGKINEIIDNNSTLPEEKVEEIYNLFSSELAPYKVKILLKEIDSNIEMCQDSQDFDSCFGDLNVYGVYGEEPSNTTIAHRKYFILRKSPSAECEILETYLLKDYSLPKSKVYFDSDLNVSFGVSLTPSSDLQCGQDIVVDLNLTAYDYGRKASDTVLVIDRSGSMDDYTAYSEDIGSGSFNSGTYSSNWLGCHSYGNWQDLETFTIDSNYSEGFGVQTTYTGYSGNCSYPRFRVKSPTNNYYPSSSGSGSGSPNLFSVSSPSTGIWTLQGWADDTISYNSKLYKKKITVAKQSANAYVDYSSWISQDYIGLVSYSDNATIDESLTNNRQNVKDEIDDLSADGGTATGTAIYKATDEIEDNKQVDSYLFQVLLSDGQTNTGSSSYNAALDANSKGITIYTIGLGDDANETELTQIAEATGGQYYTADDENALRSVYDLIAIEIGASLAVNKVRLYNSNIYADIGDCNWVSNSGSGSCSNGTITYSIPYFDDDNPWTDSYTINYPCTDNTTCSSPDKNFPGTSSELKYYNEVGGTQYTTDWNTSLSRTLLYRDLELSLLSPQLVSKDLINLDANIANIGTLSSSSVDLEFYLNSISSENLLQEVSIPALSPGSSHLQEGINLSGEGLIYGILDPDDISPDCSNNDLIGFYCYGSGYAAHYFVLEVWIWQ